MHRVALARLECSLIQTIYIEDIPTEYPYYAYPRPTGWNGIEMVNYTEFPADYNKKWHRLPYPHYKNLFRSFNSAFLAKSQPRKRKD